MTMILRPRVSCAVMGAALLATVLATGSPADATATGARTAAAAPAAVDLPPLPGPFQVGTVPFELVDHSRLDPFAPAPQPRALMVQLWYPAVHADRYPLEPYLPAGAASYIDQANGLPAGTVESVRAHGRLGAPVAPTFHGWPVVLFSPGSGASRAYNTTLVEDVASHGYAVVAIDHPYDADVVEFPDGHLVLGKLTDANNVQAVQVRAQDASFVIDQLTQLNAGRRLRGVPEVPGLRGRLDVRRVAMFGHSLGGAASAAAMLADRRISAGVDLDGSLYGPVVRRGLDRPFLLMSSALHNRADDSSWAELWSHLRGWRLDLEMAGSGHLSYSDLGVLAVPLDLTALYPPEELPGLFGTIDGVRAATVAQAYLTAFFGFTLRHRADSLLQRPDPRYPEMIFQP